jgi:hypothetical protein
MGDGSDAANPAGDSTFCCATFIGPLATKLNTFLRARLIFFCWL